jgi:hypothetical protein
MAWKIARHETVERGLHPDARRLTELSLAMIVPWKDGFPRYWLNETNEQQRMREILDATENEKLPWQF